MRRIIILFFVVTLFTSCKEDTPTINNSLANLDLSDASLLAVKSEESALFKIVFKDGKKEYENVRILNADSSEVSTDVVFKTTGIYNFVPGWIVLHGQFILGAGEAELNSLFVKLSTGEFFANDYMSLNFFAGPNENKFQYDTDSNMYFQDGNIYKVAYPFTSLDITPVLLEGNTAYLNHIDKHGNIFYNSNGNLLCKLPESKVINTAKRIVKNDPEFIFAASDKNIYSYKLNATDYSREIHEVVVTNDTVSLEYIATLNPTSFLKGYESVNLKGYKSLPNASKAFTFFLLDASKGNYIGAVFIPATKEFKFLSAPEGGCLLSGNTQIIVSGNNSLTLTNVFKGEGYGINNPVYITYNCSSLEEDGIDLKVNNFVKVEIPNVEDFEIQDHIFDGESIIFSAIRYSDMKNITCRVGADKVIEVLTETDASFKPTSLLKVGAIE